MVQDYISHVFTARELADFFSVCVSRGWIRDNNVPITEPEDKWWRAFVLDAENVMEYLALKAGKKCSAGLLYSGVKSFPPPAANYTQIEWTTKSGSHFTLGHLNGDGTIQNLYDPGPVFPRSLPIKSVRHWRLYAN